ncbi:MAG TPA: hypothetical protein VI383_03910, partial [Gemmatimonadales bacterium]|nr:hypothetical protein [Gemmatimonadales bacterium]
PGAGPCFASRAGGEVLVEGLKVVGSAQLRQGDAFLQHGSLLLQDDQSMVGELLKTTSPSEPLPFPPASAARAAPLSLLVGRVVTFDEAAAAVTEAADSLPGGVGRTGGAEGQVADLMERHGSRFRSPDWTWER